MTSFHASAAAVLRLLVLCLVFTAGTQSSLTAQKTIGLKAGIMVSSYNVSGEIDEDFDSGSGLGYYGELSAHLPFGASGFGFNPLVGFTFRQTAKFNTELQESNTFPLIISPIENGSDEMNTLSIGGLFTYSIPGKNITPFFETGPWVSVFLNGTTKAEGSALEIQQDNTLRYVAADIERDIQFGSSSNDYFKPSTFSWIFGAGLKAEFEFGILSIGARYIPMGDIRSKESAVGPGGFLPAYLDQDGSILARAYQSDDRVKLRNLQLTIGYAFPLGGY